MDKDLTQSLVDRQNVLNNPFALTEARKIFNIKQMYFTNQQIADFYDVSLRTITATIAEHEEELSKNGLEVLQGKRLRDILSHNDYFGNADIYTTKTTKMTVSSFKTVLNFSMLLKTSDRAREVRTRILDITMDVLNGKTYGDTKYINRNDKDFLTQSQREAVERKNFTNSLRNYIKMGNYKYAYFTNEVYKAIFRERAQEYKVLLKLAPKDNIRNTLYSEVLVIIASFEAGLASEFEKRSLELNRSLSKEEADNIILSFSEQALFKPLLDNARTLMASRDNSLRDVQHPNLSEYITAMSEEDYEKFLGEQSKSLEQQIKENRDVFERLKDK
ncbi:MAG: DNA-binding protein [Pseudolactococcus laudensis]